MGKMLFLQVSDIKGHGYLRPQYIVVLFLMIFIGCTKENSPDFHGATPYKIQIPLHFPQELNIPIDNPMTIEGVELGRFLFYDGRISGRSDPDSLMSCSTCHLQENSFVCGIDNPRFPGGRPFGITGIPTPHAMLPLINLVWTNSGYLWDGSVCVDNPSASRHKLEDLVWMGIVAPHEMSGDTNQSKTLISQISEYPPLFKKAFGSDVITMKNMSRAIAQFIRTLISADSKFDKLLKGQIQLTPQELNGYVLFMTEEGADCFHCHGGEGNPLFTTNLFYNNGKDSAFTDTRDRFHFTGSYSDLGSYKAPTLRNLIFRAPYMHDGRFTTIDQVIDFYSSGVVYSPSISPLMHHVSTGGIQLTPNEKSDLKAFLLTLTDSTFVTNPAFSKPVRMPE